MESNTVVLSPPMMVMDNRGSGDWTEKKGCSVVRHDDNEDVDFHAIDMSKYQEWNQKRINEYKESKELIEAMSKYLPDDRILYANKEVIESQRAGNPVFELYYDFHTVANQKYASKYGDEESVISKRYVSLKKKVLKFLKAQKMSDKKKHKKARSACNAVQEDDMWHLKDII